ncbi:major facilitator superfamily MFS_1 [Tolumonas auensis DSM 9187]|uniref:Major facilitator superfamily MFS_1 n=1 Tax=Tolumonas auensis (strain DSM 9187 / NBRC 110442 / TA 4) TaxID=595494 RepID=C4LES0_TOLAT|nr:MFS transporter [Tolumonas auensis]ACQ93087.1 major facilitator superfamily MFS_1 [Tolumonas auensis DSM 9187]
MEDSQALVQPKASDTRFRVLGAISMSHFLNDMLQSLIFAIYPLLKGNYDLNFTQIGLLTLTYQLTASILQPMVGFYTDKHPKPYSLVVGMGSTCVGLLLLSQAHTFPLLLIAAAMVGLGSSIFHPESSRVARMASGGRHGLAQSIFQVGGNAGTATGPLLAAVIIFPFGQGSLAWFSLAALLAMFILWKVGNWYRQQHRSQKLNITSRESGLSRTRIMMALGVLLLLITSKYLYLASLTNYYTFYLMHHFGLNAQNAQYHLFIFLFAVAAGTVLGGPIGDKVGRKRVIWFSILGVAPFTLALPHADLFWTSVLSFVIGFILASAFSAILVYAQELVPGRVGTISGLFFGFAFGIAGIGAALMGQLADHYGIEYVYQLCGWLPLMGVITALLPTLKSNK